MPSWDESAKDDRPSTVSSISGLPVSKKTLNCVPVCRRRREVGCFAAALRVIFDVLTSRMRASVALMESSSNSSAGESNLKRTPLAALTVATVTRTGGSSDTFAAAAAATSAL